MKSGETPGDDVESTLKPPIRSPVWFDRFFEILRVRKIDKVDADFVKVNITSDPSSASKFLAGLRFLGLIEGDGSATARLDRLRLTGDEFSKNLGEVVRESYKAIFDQISIQDAKMEDLVNFFIEKYGYSGDFARRAVAVFLHLAGKAKIQVSGALAASEIRPMAETRAKPPGNRTKRTAGKTSMANQQEEAIPDGIEQLQMGQVKIWLPKKDPAAAQTAKDLIELYLRTFKG